MSALPSVNVDQLINTRPMTPMQWRIVLLCFLVIALDGFDVAIMGFIAPELARDWAVSKLSLEGCLEFLAQDELLEVTPENLRIRKQILNHDQRMKAKSKLK